ncbi:head GIN domain-containing protein [Cellulophaga tyrosinoxydans]|uniref:Putative auto-transporter adhesin, head GIN domain n=1 Tax=Cellulophaga tyrosinoxydans TaxID=504486 RepID=A0A1W2A780_9FLAO|nr:head GIN domain-containing protein [Cellulophaga tyrosinoxydans]SMC56520.1 Putative auto-transporter adhesin, head GIN domain [Cellulophaga tyrosinoxydans]
MKNITTLIVLLIALNSCTAQWGKRIKGNGNITTIKKSVGDYESLDMAGFFDVKLIEGKEGNITITGEENLLEYIVTEVKDGKLILKTEKGVNLQPSHRNGIKITIPVEQINSVYLSGSGDITSEKTLTADSFKATISGSGDISLDLAVKELKTSISGSGDIELTGNTDTFDLSISGSGDIDAFKLAANHVDVSVSGSGDIEVTANKSIKARVSGSGDINYRGNPEKVDTKSSGSGDISKG